MNHRNRFLRLLLAVLCLVATVQTRAQGTCLVFDRASRQPVSCANLYAKEGGKFRAAMTNSDGRATLDFSFRRLTVSHLNYEKCQLTRLPDTIWLTPKSYVTAEVVVAPEEPAWIRRVLKRFVKQKERKYNNSNLLCRYEYQSNSISKRSFYQYQSAGILRQRDKQGHDSLSRFGLLPATGIITATDSTKRSDMKNLRHILYEDFVEELNREFISDHYFAQNTDYQPQNASDVELVFRSKKGDVDRGRIVIDTARLIIRSAHRASGTKANLRTRMPMVMYRMAQLICGYKMKDWQREYSVRYAQHGDTQYIAEAHFQEYMATEERTEDAEMADYYNQISLGFPNMEAHFSATPLAPTDAPPDPATDALWLNLPPPYYVRYSTEATRTEEIRMANLPSEFHLAP